MKKAIVVCLLAVILVAGFVLIHNARAYGPMMGADSWWQPFTSGWQGYCPWNHWGYHSSFRPSYQEGYTGCCWMMNLGPIPGYPANPNHFDP